MARARRGPRPRRTASAGRSASGETTHPRHPPACANQSASGFADAASHRAGFRVIRLPVRTICGRKERRVNVSTSSSEILEDVRIGVRLKISALWIAMLFLFAYGDIFGFFRTGLIEEVIAGEVSGDRDHAGLPVRDLGLHRDRERDGLPVARPSAEGQPLGQHRAADPVHRFHRHLVCR